jgi:serine protease Do
MNGQPVNEPDDLSVRVAETPPGTTVHLKISRDGEMHEVSATLGELSERNEASASAAGGGASLQGVQVRSLTPSIARELGISADVSGVVITSVDPSSPAAAAGLERGDVVQEVNRKAVRSAEEYNKTLAETGGKAVLLLVNRGGSTHFVIVEPQ